MSLSDGFIEPELGTKGPDNGEVVHTPQRKV
jgi:hypothetical protein